MFKIQATKQVVTLQIQGGKKVAKNLIVFHLVKICEKAGAVFSELIVTDLYAL